MDVLITLGGAGAVSWDIIRMSEGPPLLTDTLLLQLGLPVSLPSVVLPFFHQEEGMASLEWSRV